MDIFAQITASVVQPAAAQQLARLHVRAFTLAADPVNLNVGDTMRLRIVTRVDENLFELDNVTLPDLSGFESLGDERRCASGNRGTQCIEIMTLAPTAPGDLTIGPATLEAVDARNGRPSRFATNSVRVHVAPVAGTFAGSVFDAVLKPLGILVLVAALAYAFLRFSSRRASRPALPAPVVVPPPPPTAEPPALEAMVDALAARPTRSNVLAVRGELRRRVGALERETLADLTARNAARGERNLAEALRAVEFAAFADEARLAGAIDLALRPLESLCGRPATVAP